MIIPNVFFVILIAIFTGYLTFLTTKGGLTDNRFKGINKKLTKRGKAVLVVLVIILLLLAGQEFNNQRSIEKSALLLKNEMLSRDSVITESVRNGVDSNRKALFDDLSEAFAKEQMMLDTLNDKIEILRDSVKTTIVNHYSGDDPILMMDKTAILPNDSTKRTGGYKLSFKSVDAGSSGFDVVCYILTEDKNGYDLSKFNLFPKGLKIPKNSSWTTGYGTNDMPSPKTIHIYVKGTYQNADGTKKYKIDNVYEYSSIDNKTSLLLNKARERIIAIIKSVPDKNLILR
ncbi:MAG: hypothetical protein ABL872_05370 [Lacibacter sp.]